MAGAAASQRAVILSRRTLTTKMESGPALTIRRSDLETAHGRGLLAAAQLEPLWQHLVDAAAARAAPAGAAPTHEAPRLSFTHTLYYLGGMLAIGAATLFLNEGWERLGAPGLGTIAAVYALLCVWLAQRLDARGFEIPAGIVATLAVCLVPLVVWALQHVLGLWPEGGPASYGAYHTRIDWRWLTLELATLAAAAVALWALRYPFLMMPAAETLWYMSMDLARLVVAPDAALAWEFYRDFSMLFGLLIALLAFWIDARSRSRDPARPGSGRDYAFWPYLLGVLTFWGALSARPAGSEFARALYALLGVGFIALGALLGRRVFTVCGALGVAMYLGYLSARLFRDSLLFPVALTAIGFALIACGVWWQRREQALRARLWQRLPPALRGWLPEPPA